MALIAAYLNAQVILVATGIYSRDPFPLFSPSLINLMVSVDVKHHAYCVKPQQSVRVGVKPQQSVRVGVKPQQSVRVGVKLQQSVSVGVKPQQSVSPSFASRASFGTGVLVESVR